MKRLTIATLLGALSLISAEAAKRPNILFIFSDDHALNAISAYGGPLKDLRTIPSLHSFRKAQSQKWFYA